MKLELIGVENVGDLPRERIVMRATEELDLGRYAVFKCRKTASGVPAAYAFLGGFWFAKKNIKPGDFVVLYSKRGDISEKKAEGAEFVSHFYYWDSAEPIWAGAVVPVLVATTEWRFEKSPAPMP
jgi:hypothetical protein